eukprot:Em0025g66a
MPTSQTPKQREHFQLPTIEDISTHLTGTKVSSTLDANHGYWKILLHYRMPFGITSAQEIFQKRMVQHFEDLPGVETDIDDILHHPTHQEYLFNWKQEQETAFQLIKKRMTSAPVLAFYNVKKPVTVSCDVSNFGLGAVLLQEIKPMAYASRALNDTEKRYAQIEKELLAVVYALEKFNHQDDQKKEHKYRKKSKNTGTGQNIRNKWFNHERGTVGNTYWLKDRDAETNTHGPHGDSKVFPACQGTDVLARHVQSQCDMCQEYRGSNQKEPTIPGPTPKHPWEEIATDLFHWSDHDYLIIVDYFSRYIEVCKLEDTSSTSIITHTTSVLAQHGIPMVIRSDNGTQYTAEEYKRFTKEWGIQHVTTSPYHTQANGLAEKSVQIIKSLLNQSKANNQDPYLSLLDLTTETKIIPSEVVQRTPKRSTQKWYHDKGAKPLSELEKGDEDEKTRWKEVPKNPQTSVKYQVRNDHYNATKHKEGTDVGGDVQPEHEVTQNEDQQQESLTEEEDDVAEVGVKAVSAAQAAECMKHQTNDTKCFDLGWSCVPQAVETYGCWAPSSEFAVAWDSRDLFNALIETDLVNRHSGLVGVVVANGSGDTLHHGKLWSAKP